jgi:hypothetical protein
LKKQPGLDTEVIIQELETCLLYGDIVKLGEGLYDWGEKFKGSKCGYSKVSGGRAPSRSFRGWRGGIQAGVVLDGKVAEQEGFRGFRLWWSVSKTKSDK